MAWYDLKSPAADPDNPTADEQFPYSEHNAMVLYLKDKLIGKVVDDSAIGDDKILVYKSATDKFVFEDPSAVGAIDDLTDVVISGVPADNEILGYDDVSSKWINQTAAEAGLATTTQLTALETAAVLEADFNATTFLYATADDTPQPKTPAEVMAILSGAAGAEFLFNTQNVGGIVDPTTAQQAATKNYADAHLFTKEAVTSFLDGYIPVYRTLSGKFEMEEGGGSAGLPVVDTTNIVKGSVDGTKLMRFEVDGITSGITRVMTVPDKDITLCDTAEALLLSGGTMAGNIDINDFKIDNVDDIQAFDTNGIQIRDSTGTSRAYFARTALGRHEFNYPLSMASNKITDLALGTSSTDAIRMAQAMLVDGSQAMTGTMDLGTNDINDIGALILNDATELTIDVAGQVTATQSFHTIDTYADGATDDLDSIAGGTAGQILVIQAADSTRTVVAKHGTDNLLLEGDMTLDNDRDTLTLIFTGTWWKELSRSNNGA